VFTGDSLFVNSAGRPDLMGDDQVENLVEQLHDTLYSFFLSLDNGVIIYPGHGKGSPCGADIGDRLTSTIGYERRFNPFLQHPDQTTFKDFVLSTAPPEPKYYKRMKQINAAGPEVLGRLPIPRGLPPAAFRASAGTDDVVVVDTRSMLDFGGGHIAGALNIGGSPELSIWAGWLLDPGTPAFLVLDRDEDAPDGGVVAAAHRIHERRWLPARRDDGMGQGRIRVGRNRPDGRPRVESHTLTI
jgi:hydroxyacylglutathione hydrolase